MSLHSPLSPSSGRSVPDLFLTDDMPLPPQRTIERMSSYPSLSYSSTTAASDDQHDPAAMEVLTPLDKLTFATGTAGVSDQDEEQELLSPVQEKRGFRGLTKSMQSLRGRAKADKERSRSSSRERPPLPAVEPTLKAAPIARATQPIAIPAPARPKPQRSGSSFSSFIRKLTGKSAKPATPVTVPAPIPAFKPERAARPSPRSRKPTLAIDTGASTSAPRPAHVRKTSLPLDLVVPIPVEPVVEMAPLTAPPRAPTIKLVDPRTVPLPPSPPSPAFRLADEESLDFSLSPASYDRVTTSALSLQVSKDSAQSRMIVEEEDEDEEEDDVVRPLPGLSSNQSGRISTSPVSASTIHETEVRIPLSPSFPQHRDGPRHGSMGGSSPPRQAPMAMRQDSTIRKDQGGNLGRKESKWRKSVMNLSDTLNGQSKRVSKVPPSSYDAYQIQQQRIANNRRSCAPTLHSTGTVSAEIRQIKDKEQQDMADTFFLS